MNTYEFLSQIEGAPQVLQYTVERNMDVEKGQDAVIQIVFCSDPRPSRTSWEWGSYQLEAGKDRGRYVAENLAQDVRDDCYSARLRVLGVDVGDARDYVLNVENDKGADRYAVGLRVSEPVSMSTVIGIVIACLVLLVLVTLIVLYAFKTEKWCFSQRGDFKPTDLESDKSDLESQKGTNGRHQYCGTDPGRGRTGVRSGEVGGRTSRLPSSSIPPDALYTAPRSSNTVSSKPDHEYENLKIMPTRMETPNSCQVMRSNSSCSSNSSQQKKDELTASGEETGETEARRKEKEEQETGREEEMEEREAGDHRVSGNTNLMLTFKKQDEGKDAAKIYRSPHYVPVYQPHPDHINTTTRSPYHPKVKTNPTSPIDRTSVITANNLTRTSPGTPQRTSLSTINNFSRTPVPSATNNNNNSSGFRKPSSAVIYAELQLPRASNNGSMRRSEPYRHPSNKTQYAEITFQGRPLQTAEI
ncbi:hypothetical protein Pcinc_013721 [Petrolisthes cinctipes]|uniref:Uncharacterized protein n=1 Tax=Petrolisthes cinctipes TaxID=88211 RepID=A0AAE1FY20_PETCI|nr:hypothetical protein Pcinc_013721 [Petrolisthes cinctipes]